MTTDQIFQAVENHASDTLPRLRRLWNYYRNPMLPGRRGRWYRLAQEAGLPARVTGGHAAGLDDRALPRREVVVENDIAWRIHTMVDFMFGRPVRFASTAGDETLRREIDLVLDAAWERSGGVALLQDAALLAHVYGHVDLVLRIDPAIEQAGAASGRAGAAAETDGAPRPDAPRPGGPALDSPRAAALRRAAGFIRIEAVEPTRGVAILDENDFRVLRAFAIHAGEDPAPPESTRPIHKRAAAPRGAVEVFEPGRRRLFRDGRLVGDTPSLLEEGELGVVHVQNIAQPFRYEGLGEVEPLIPLQDELNTRLSDRASRVTMQCFKMYLAKHLDGFDRFPVGPGQVWSTDEEKAEIKEFGGDASSPSEDQHILEIREAMDKISGVPPIATGVVKAKIGNLSSANALRITLMGVLGKTARKRVTYGRALAEVCRLVLGALDRAGVLHCPPEQRAVKLDWADPLPLDPNQEVLAAQARLRLGVPREQVLAELGYGPSDPGVI